MSSRRHSSSPQEIQFRAHKSRQRRRKKEASNSETMKSVEWQRAGLEAEQKTCRPLLNEHIGQHNTTSSSNNNSSLPVRASSRVDCLPSVRPTVVSNRLRHSCAAHHEIQCKPSAGSRSANEGQQSAVSSQQSMIIEAKTTTTTTTMMMMTSFSP